MNVVWWLLNGPRAAGLLLGLLTGLAFGIYPSAIYVVVTMLTLALIDRQQPSFEDGSYRLMVPGPGDRRLRCDTMDGHRTSDTIL